MTVTVWDTCQSFSRSLLPNCGSRTKPPSEKLAWAVLASESDVRWADLETGFLDKCGFLTFDLFARLQLGGDPPSYSFLSFGLDNLASQTYRFHANLLNSPGRTLKLVTHLHLLGRHESFAYGICSLPCPWNIRQ